MRRFTLLSILLCLAAVNASAITSEYRILLDLDNNPATGCTVATVDGNFTGVEQVLITTVDTVGMTATVTSVARQECTAGTFGAAIPVGGGWPVGIGNGVDGFNVIETYFPLPAGFLATPRQVRLAVTTSSDALLVSQPGGSSPIIIFLEAIAAIPTLGEWALIFSALLLITAAMFRMKQRQTIAVLFLVCSFAFTGVAMAAIILDGQTTDWTAGDLLANDMMGDGATDGDIRAFFGRLEAGENRIYFRIDGSLAFSEPPTANAATAGTSLDTPVTVTLTGSDPEGDPLTFTVVTAPASGTLGAVTVVNDTTSQVQYTPNSGFTGSDSFTFVANDGSSNSAPATATITVSNTIPVANAQSTSTATNTPVTITLTGTDPNSDPLTFSIVDNPASGSLGAITPLTATSAQVQYTPTTNFEGNDSFTFRVSDGTNDSTPATVTISVENGLPSANPQTVTTTQDNAVTITLSGSDPESSPLTFSIVTNPTNGTLGAITPIDATSASVLYTPNSGFTGNDSFTFRVNDGTSDSSPATVTINVELAPSANDDGPAAGSAPGDPFHTAVDAVLNSAVSVLANDTGFPAPTVTASDTATAQGGTVSVNADGTFSYTPPAGFIGFDTFSYTAGNSQGTDTATVTIAVGARPAALDDSYGVAAGSTLTVPAPGLLGNDSGSSIDVSAVNGNSANVGNPVSVGGGTLTVNADGSLTFDAPATPGTANFTYTISNGLGTSTANVVIGVDEAPVANDDFASPGSSPGDPYHTAINTSINSSAGTPYSVLDNDTGGPAPTVESFGPATGAETPAGSGGVTANGGTVTVAADGTFVYTPPSGFTGLDTFVYTATNTVGSDTATVTIIVGVSPDATDDSYNVGTGNILNVAAPGVLANDNGSPALTVIEVNGSAANVGNPIAVGGGTLTLNADGSFSYSAGASPEAPTFTYTIQNNIGTSQATVTINVLQGPTAVDDAPAANSVPGDDYHTDVDVALDSGAGTPYSILSNDLGSSISVASFGPATGAETAAGATGASAEGGVLSVQATGIFTYTPPAGFVGLDTFQYTIQNSVGTDVGEVTIAVGDRLDAVDDEYDVAPGGTLNIAAPGVLANDTGDGAKTVTEVNGNAADVGAPIAVGGGTLTLNADGSFTYNAPAAPATVNFTYTATSPLGSDTATVTIDVLTPPTATDDGPAADSDPGDNYHAALNGSITAAYSVLANDSGSPTLEVDSFGPATGTETPAGSAGSTSQGGTLTLNADGTFSYTAPASFIGLDTFQYVVSNAVGSDTGTVTIAVGTRPEATSDAYGSIGNVGLTINAANGVIQKATADSGDAIEVTLYGTVGNPATTPGNNFTTTNGGTVNMAADGSFTYMPAAGFEGSDTFDYRIANGLGTDDATVTITVSGMMWFVDASAPAGGDGRINTPFNCLVGTDSGAQTCFSNTPLDAVNESIFLHDGTYAGNGPLVLLSGQRLIGQGASFDTAVLAGLVVPTGSNPLPATNGANPVITSTGNGVNLSTNNHVHGLTIGNTGGIDISGSTFGTLTLEDVTLNGSGRPLSLATGTITGVLGGATFEGITSTSSSGGQGILLQAVGGSLESTGGTSITSPATQPILITGSSVVTSFGNTTVSGGTDGVSLQNNSGTTTFGTLSISTGSGVGLLHSAGGGAVTAGATTITNPAGTGISVDASNANLSFGNTTVTKNSTGGTGVNLTNNTLRTITFNTLGVTTSNGTAINATGGGTINVTNTGGAISATDGPAMNANGVVMDAEFSSTTSTNSGTSGISLNSVSGTGVSFGNTTANSSAATGVLLQSNTAPISFADLDIAPDSGQRALHATSNTGLLVSTSGTVSATNNIAVEIAGASTASTTPLNLTLTSVSASGGGNGIVLTNTSSSGIPGGFNVTGSGSTAASGGTLGSMAGADGATSGIAVRLDNASNIVLANMNITGTFGNFGIRGDNVVNFTLRDSTMSGQFGSSNAADEGAIRFGTDASSTNGLTGTALFEGNNISGGYEDNLGIHNYGAGNVNVTIRDSANDQAVFGSQGIDLGGGTHSGNDSVVIQTGGNSNSSATILIEGVQFTAARGDIVQTNASGNTTQNINIRNNTFHNGHVNITSGGGGVFLSGGGNPSNYTVTYNFENNSLRGAEGNAFSANYHGTAGVVRGTILNNTVGNPNGVHNSDQANTGSNGGGDGIAVSTERFNAAGTLTHAVRIQGNTIRDLTSGIGGIAVRSNSFGAGTGRVEATIVNNSIAELGTFQLTGIYALAGGAAGTGDFALLGSVIQGNSITMPTGAGNFGSNAITFDQISTDAQHYVPGYAGSGQGEFATPAGTASAGLSAYLAGAPNNNTMVNGPFPTFAGGGVDAAIVDGLTGSPLVLPVP